VLTLFEILSPLLLHSGTAYATAASIAFHQHSLIQQLLVPHHEIVFKQTLERLTFETHFDNYFRLRLNFGSKLHLNLFELHQHAAVLFQKRQGQVGTNLFRALANPTLHT
jgi:hypothetical protein